MSTRYTVIKQETNSLFTVDCPIQLVRYQILFDTKENRTICRFAFTSMASKKVNLIRFRISCFDATGKEIEKIDEQSIAIPENQEQKEFGSEKLFVVPDETNAMNVLLTRIVFADGNQWENKKPLLAKNEPKRTIVDGEQGNYIREKAKEAGVFVKTDFYEGDGYWQCSCGQLNSGEKCILCGKEKAVIAPLFDTEKMKEKKEKEFAEDVLKKLNANEGDLKTWQSDLNTLKSFGNGEEVQAAILCAEEKINQKIAKKEAEDKQKAIVRKKKLKIGLIIGAIAAVLIVGIVLGSLAAVDTNLITREFTFTKKAGGYSLQKYNGKDKDVIVPSTFCGKPVVKIGGAFEYNSSVESVTIPDSVTSIGDSAFCICTSLTSITIPDSVTSIGEWAFAYCTSLTSITIPDNVTSIGQYAFYNCTSLTSITIPDSVTSIGSYAFKKCTSLASVTFGADSQLTSIGYEAFRDCTSLTSITIPDSVTSIGGYAFSHCTSLTSITIPDGVTSIGNGAFNNCTGLTSVTIGNGVTSIGSSAFRDCTSLTSITIPDSVTSLGWDAFEDCTSLTSIVFNGTKAQWNAISKSSLWDYNTGNYTIYCTNGYISKD